MATTSTHPIEKHESQLQRLEKTVENHEGRLQEIEKTSVAFDERLKRYYEDIGAIKALVANIDNKIDAIFRSLDARITALEKRETERDAKKWQAASKTVLAAVLTGVVGYLLRGLLP